MTIGPEIKSYLEALNTALYPLDSQERSEIVEEMKSHILELCQARPEQDVDKLLQSIGDPWLIGKLFLDERGVAQQYGQQTQLSRRAGSHSQQEKWDKKERGGSHLLRVEGNKVSLFGDFIQVDGDRGRLKVGDIIDFDDKSHKVKFGRYESAGEHEDFFSGEVLKKHTSEHKQEFTEKLPRAVKIMATAAETKVKVHSEACVFWKWTGFRLQPSRQERQEGDEFIVDYSQFGFGKLEVCVPKGVVVKLEQDVGSVSVEKPQKDCSVSLRLGAIKVETATGVPYDIATDVSVGQVDCREVQSSQEGTPVRLNLKVGTGKITVKD